MKRVKGTTISHAVLTRGKACTICRRKKHARTPHDDDDDDDR